MLQYVQDQAASRGSHSNVRQPAVAPPAPPMMLSAPAGLAPLRLGSGAGHDEYYMQSYLMAHQYLHWRGLLALVILYDHDFADVLPKG